MRFGWLLALLSFALLLDASVAWCSGRDRVVIVGVPANGALGRQLRIELSTRGFDVLLLEPEVDGERAQLERVGREPEVLAAICVASEAGGGVEIWLKSAGVLSLHSVEASHAAPRVTALRSAERLRASLLELRAEPAPPPPLGPASVPTPDLPTPSPESGSALRREKPPRWGFGVGGAALVSPGGLDRVFSVTPSVDVWFHRDWGAALRAFVPLNDVELEGPEGSTSLSLTVFALGPILRVRPAATRWQLDAQLAGALALLHMKASTAPPFESHDARASSAGVLGSLAVGYRIGSAFRLSSGVLLGSMFPEMQVRFGERTAATWGSLYGGGTVSLHTELD
jgi:hypothetical protein